MNWIFNQHMNEATWWMNGSRISQLISSMERKGIHFSTCAAIVSGKWISEFPPNSNNLLQHCRLCVLTCRTPTSSPDVHKSPMQDQMLLLCCCCRVTHIFINHYHFPPLSLNNRAYGLPCLPLCPQRVRGPACSSSRSHKMKKPKSLICP